MKKRCQSRSYQLHNGVELQLMLSGSKPFAAFCKLEIEDFDVTGGQNFDLHVKNGTLKRIAFKVRALENSQEIEYILYCLIGEEWRFSIFRALKSEICTNWNKEKELIEGLLLGYTLDQCIEHVTKLYD